MLTGSVLCLVLFGATHASAADTWPHQADLPHHDLESRLIADCIDGALDHHSLLVASLIAGGVEDAESLVDHAAKFRLIAGRVTTQTPSKIEDAPLREHARQLAVAQELLAQMHRVMLTGRYQADCSDLRETIQRGDYNCVSATVVYQILCDQNHIPTRAVAIPAHVFSVVTPATWPSGSAKTDAGKSDDADDRYGADDTDSSVDVQTTCSTWLGAGKGRTSAKETAPRRTLTPVQLLGKIYYNRGVLALRDANFAEAVRVLRISLILDGGDAIAQKNLLAAINNWSLAEANVGRFASAARLLSIGRSIDSAFQPFQANDLHIHQRWTQRLCRDKRFRFAIAVLEDGLRRRPTAELFDNGRYLVLQMWATDLWEKGSLSDGFKLFDREWDAARLNDILVQSTTTAASQLVAKTRLATARELVRQAQRKVDDDRLDRLARHLATLDSN